MRSGYNFPDSVPPVANYVQMVCSVCKESININTIYQINGQASCHDCYTDHQISVNVCRRPYRIPRSRKFATRAPADQTWITSSITTTAATQAFIKNPQGGL